MATLVDNMKLNVIVDVYARACSRFDELICTGRPSANGTFMPADDEEARLCREHAAQEKEQALAELERLGFDEADFNEAHRLLLKAQRKPMI